jgi:hypothetical protein
MMIMRDTVAHTQITAETIYDSAQRNRRLAHELLYLVRLRDEVRRAEASQKARAKFGPRDRRKRVRHALKIRCRLFRSNSSESRLPQQNAFIESFNGRLGRIEVSSIPGTRASFAAWPTRVLLETFDGSHLLSALTLQPDRASNDNPFST